MMSEEDRANESSKVTGGTADGEDRSDTCNVGGIPMDTRYPRSIEGILRIIALVRNILKNNICS